MFHFWKKNINNNKNDDVSLRNLVIDKFNNERKNSGWNFKILTFMSCATGFEFKVKILYETHNMF